MTRRSSPKQLRQQKLSWSLRILLGASASIRAFLPNDLIFKKLVLNDLDACIKDVRSELKRIK